MTKFITLLLTLCVCTGAFAQGTTIGANNPPDASATLDLQSTTGGLLLPRLTTAQRNAISNPATALHIYNTTTNCVQVYFPTSGWQDVRCDCQSFPSANFTFPNQVGVGVPATFTASTPGLTYSWSFQGGSPSTGTNQTESVTWPSIGTYTVILTVTDNIGCSNSDTVTINVINCPPNTVTFNFTGSQATFVVPGCVTQIQVDAYGAQGAQGAANPGGLGGRVQATLTVTPGETIYIYVGGQPSGTAAGYNGGGVGGTSIANLTSHGGGGGGATDIRRSGIALTDRVLVAGGGGGSGGPQQGGGGGGAGGGYYGGGGGGWSLNCCTATQATNGQLGIGGNGGTHITGCSCSNNALGGGTGGAGGGLTGGAGGQGNASSGGGGGGGTQSAGGAGGVAGQTCSCNDQSQGGGAGGGSSWVTGIGSSNITHTQGVRTGNGMITISY